MVEEAFFFTRTFYKVADSSSLIHLRKQATPDGAKMDLNVGETRVWWLDSGPWIYNPVLVRSERPQD